jgi:CBS domain-containing protein
MMQASGLQSQDSRIIDHIRPVDPVYRESSLAAALERLRNSGSEALPVVDGSYLVGALWADDVRSAVLAGAPMSMPVAQFVDESAPILSSMAAHSEAHAVMTASSRPAVMVVDPDGRYLGIVRVFDLYSMPNTGARPPVVGGMATPMGVYLTNGGLRAGASAWALVLTGVAMTSMLLVGVLVTALIHQALPVGTPSLLKSAVVNLLPIGLFFLQVRLSPIAATHGAEHMVVHAIERGEPLRPDIVRRMPRVHPRCGTNLAVGALVFTGIVQVTWSTFQEAGALLALVLTLSVWKPLGSLAQKFVTTKTPRDKDVDGAIAAAEELIAKYRQGDRRLPTVTSRLVSSGLPLILIGSFAAIFIAEFVLQLAGLSELLTVLAL